jgi:hypothetical protein
MRLPRTLILVLVAAASLLAMAATPAAASSCARAVINDWYKHGEVQGHYPAHCYTEAIAILPEDVHQYSNAPDDIRRAMLLALRGDGPAGTQGPGDGGRAPTGFTGPDVSAAGQTSTDKGHKNGAFGGLINSFGPKNASSIPLPLIVLAAVALLLLAAGAASFAARRIQARRVPPPRP